MIECRMQEEIEWIGEWLLLDAPQVSYYVHLSLLLELASYRVQSNCTILYIVKFINTSAAPAVFSQECSSRNALASSVHIWRKLIMLGTESFTT